MATGLIGRPTFGGLASGLDTNALLSGLLEIERIPLNRLQSRRSEIQTQRNLMRELNSKLVTLSDAAKALDNRNDTGSANSASEEFLRYSGSSSNENVVTVSAGSGASPGDIDVLVQELATGSRRFSTAYTDPDAIALAEGTAITIALPNGDPDAIPEVEPTVITVTGGEGGTSLQNLRDQINTSADNGSTVRADVLQVSDSEFRLVLTSTGTGDSNNLFVSGALAIDPALSSDATNATVQIFGQTIERETNFIDDVLTGVTLELVGPAELDDDDVPQSETLTIGVDVEEIATGIESFITAYNDVVSFIDQQFSYNETTKTSGPLAGDSTLRGVQSRLRDMVSRGYAFEANPNNPFAPSGEGALGGSITGIGITLESGGRLSLDQEKLEEALARDALSVAQFFRGNVRSTPANQDQIDLDPTITPDLYDEGFAQLFAQELEGLVRSGDGTLAEREEAFERRIRTFDDSIERFEARLSQREESLVLRFSELERIVAGLQNQQGFLSSIPA
ncbi:MAG: flagellar filament capping protein FliD [bacterium]|nr:flagellar filament capping protein FliD [bacterium]